MLLVILANLIAMPSSVITAYFEILRKKIGFETGELNPIHRYLLNKSILFSLFIRHLGITVIFYFYTLLIPVLPLVWYFIYANLIFLFADTGYDVYSFLRWWYE